MLLETEEDFLVERSVRMLQNMTNYPSLCCFVQESTLKTQFDYIPLTACMKSRHLRVKYFESC